MILIKLHQTSLS